MAEFQVVEESDLITFTNELNRYCTNGRWGVKSSNAFKSGEETRYYALLEKVHLTDYKGIVKDLLDSIDSRLSSIDSNTTG